MKALLLTLAVLFITGCAQLGPKVVETKTLKNGDVVKTQYSEDAYAQDRISDENKQKHKSVGDCVSNCDVDMADLSEVGQVAASMAHMAGKPMDFCGCAALANAGNNGRNHFDSKTEIAQSRHDMAENIVGDFASAGVKVTVVKEVGKTQRSANSNAGDRYDVDVNQNNSSSSSGGEATSSEGIENATAGTTPSTGTGGSGGSPSSTQDGPDNNIINIGPGNVAIAEERAAAGQSALLNGDSAVIANIKGELKASNVGEDVATDQDGFDDSGEGSNNSLIDL